jgi:hypothetical protein
MAINEVLTELQEHPDDYWTAVHRRELHAPKQAPPAVQAAPQALPPEHPEQQPSLESPPPSASTPESGH